MRRALSAVLSVAALAVAMLAIGVSSAGGESGPACADITGANTGPASFWNSATGEGTINVQLLTASGTACKQITYTVVVSGVNAGPIVRSLKGQLNFTITYTDTDANICISAMTSAGGGRVHDAAPDAGCAEITSGTGGGRLTFG